MIKKLFLTIISICILSIPILGHTKTIELPYNSKDGEIYISIELPSAITRDFSKWSYTRSALNSDKGLICKLTFTNEESNTTYILYVFCRAPIVVGLKASLYGRSLTLDFYWKYISKKPVATPTPREFYHFLDLLNGDL